MKPDTTTAMHQLIRQIRAATPFDLAEARICDGPCNGCSLKLLDYLESELEGWQARLDQGVRPNFGDLSQLADSGRKIHRILQRNGLLDSAPPTPPNPSLHADTPAVNQNRQSIHDGGAGASHPGSGDRCPPSPGRRSAGKESPD